MSDRFEEMAGRVDRDLAAAGLIGDRETWRRRILADALREAHRRGVDEGASTALRRAEEAEAIANLAMAEGLRAADALRGNFPRQCPHCRAAGDEPCEDVCLERAREYEELAREYEDRHWESMRDAYEDHYRENMRDAYGRAADA